MDMSRDDVVASMQAAVKMEVVEHYFRERCIIQEEIAMVFESSQEYHNLLAEWRKERDTLLTVLFTHDNINKFSEMSGLAPFECCILLDLSKLHFPRPSGTFTRHGRYRRLLSRLYSALYDSACELNKKRSKIQDLCQEVNRDIKYFEVNYDLLTITAYVRALSPAELQKRKILGVNFTAAEKAHAATVLSFKPIRIETLHLDLAPDPMVKPEDILPRAKPFFKKISHKYANKVDSLFIFD